jgi:hypothetical protein
MLLNVNHPLFEIKMEAAGLLDQLLAKSQKMTVSSSNVRLELLDQCAPLFERLRELNVQHFGRSAFIILAIDEYELGLRELANLGDGQIAENRYGESKCPYCGNEIINVPDYCIVVCGQCDKFFMGAKDKLSSLAGFAI